MNKKVPEITKSAEELKSLMGNLHKRIKSKNFPCSILDEVDTPKIANKLLSC